MRVCPDLRRFVQLSPVGRDTIDFADPAAVLALNRALLRHHYGIRDWSVPPGYLCPPIPGRADYVHHVADLLRASDDAVIPHGPEVRILDIGVGANCVYPLIGATEYGWRFVATDIDDTALASARRNVAVNPHLADLIDCRLQRSTSAIFQHVISPGERFAAVICNPPFHESAAAAAAAGRRKVRNLTGASSPKPVLNFGGQSHELWIPGGESGFVRRMIAESARQPELCQWFTSLVSKRESLPAIHRALESARVSEVRTIDLSHGQKKSRIVAWRFR